MNDTAQKPPVRSSTDENRTVIDMSKMSEGQRAALQVTEAARESHDELGFVAHLFMGRFRPEKLYPLTDVAPTEQQRADRFLWDLGVFLRANVDADLIDQMHIAVGPIEIGRGERLWASPEELTDRFHLERIPSPSGMVHHFFWRR